MKTKNKIVLRYSFCSWNLAKNSTLIIKKDANHGKKINENNLNFQKLYTKNEWRFNNLGSVAHKSWGLGKASLRAANELRA